MEGAVKILYRTVYAVIKKQVHSSLEGLNQAIRKALEDYNNRLLKGRPYSRRLLFEEIERGMLHPLPERRYELKRRRIVTVISTAAASAEISTKVTPSSQTSALMPGL